MLWYVPMLTFELCFVLKIWILECNRSMSGQKFSFKWKSFQLLLFYYFFNVGRIKLKRESCVGTNSVIYLYNEKVCWSKIKYWHAFLRRSYFTSAIFLYTEDPYVMFINKIYQVKQFQSHVPFPYSLNIRL